MGRDYSSFPPLGIIAYSDFYEVPDRKVWGDYWLKENLTCEFLRLGYPVDNSNPSVILHLFGEPVRRIPADTHNILWVHSHPDRVDQALLRRYRKIYCISESFTQKIGAMGFDAEFMMVPTAMTPARSEKKYDIVFVGNTKNGLPRKIIKDLGDPGCSVKIWGWGWKDLIPPSWYGGEYFENGRLNGLYASSKIVLNDHHEDMRREGFINPRILDVLASGGFVVSDGVCGMEKLMGDSVPVYETAEELRHLVMTYLRDDGERKRLSAKGMEIALKYNFRDACLTIIRHIETISDRVFL